MACPKGKSFADCNKKWKGKSGKYNCLLTFADGHTEEREIWLFKNESMGTHITEVRDMIPGTAPKDWSHDYPQEAVENLFNAVVEQAVEDIRAAHRWVNAYSIRKFRMYCKGRTSYERAHLRELDMNKKSAEKFLNGTKIGRAIKREQIRNGTNYDLSKLYEK